MSQLTGRHVDYRPVPGIEWLLHPEPEDSWKFLTWFLVAIVVCSVISSIG